MNLRHSTSKTLDLVVVMPVGPDGVEDYILDTLDSVNHYTTPNKKIIIVDDSGKGTWQKLRNRHPDLDVIETPRNHGRNGGLYLTLSLGYLHACEHYDFKVLLKLDTDALVIGETPERDAGEFFAEHPEVGIIGLFSHGTQNDPHNHHWSKFQMRNESGLTGLLRDPRLFFDLRLLLYRARSNGFKRGDYIFGGAYFMSPECVRKLAHAGALSKDSLGRSLLEEDHIFGLLVKSVGVDMADFALGNRPMAMEWKCLPDSPEQLVENKKKIIHSTRKWNDLGEAEIRKILRQLRSTSVGSRK